MLHANNLRFNDARAIENVSRIAVTVQPEMIICYGHRKTHTRSWSPFLPSDQERTYDAYDLLIVTRADEKRPSHQIIDSVHGCLKDRTWTANVLVHNLRAMTDALAAHNFFFSRVCDEGVVLYSRCQAPLIHREEEQINALLCTQRLDVAAIKLARAFLEGASFFSSQGCNRIALFMLHQAMEHSCISLVRCMTGYRPSTHNLRRLLAMTENVSVAYSAIFPSNTAEEKDLFSILARAYSEARYKEDFAADCRTVKILIERVTLFQSCAEKFVTRTVGGLTSSRAS